jgi:DNA-binding HxlR family transcriptional regulator
VTKPHDVDGKTVKGINFFDPDDSALLHALQNPRVNIADVRRADLLADLPMFSPTRLSRKLRRLLDIGVIKRVTGTYRYLTKAGRAETAAAARLTEATIIPAMI